MEPTKSFTDPNTTSFPDPNKSILEAAKNMSTAEELPLYEILTNKLEGKPKISDEPNKATGKMKLREREWKESPKKPNDGKSGNIFQRLFKKQGN